MSLPRVGANLFHDFQKSAWRFETQPTYTMPAEAENFRLFLAGELKAEHPDLEWHRLVRSSADAGKTIGRVRVVRRPLTDYMRYQFHYGIPNNIACGEDIRILDATDLALDLPDQDFWFFDETVVLHLNFRPDGTLIDRELVDDPNLDVYRRWKTLR